ncbi:IS1595 family transposase [uncultured Thiodictyon sp.]|jgi:transposase-like protein|uniref:IS1595 family transposase n=1 Tax=uncultured Thiodictyon sp. TaxID=1846217 RepID=UPI0025F3F25B|nr:IS1595 family transposase [uncultured Thiodictyon sp.]
MPGSHFLLTAAARTLSLREVFAMTDDQAFTLFRETRWGRDGAPVCPSCGVVEHHWFLPSRQQWRCRACGHTFSVTSGTLFAHHKLPLQVYLAAVVIYSNAVKGLSALQLSRDLDLQYKTAFVLMHKLRESLMVQRDETPLVGEVQLDGAYVGGSVRPANRAEDRVDRRLVEHQNPDKRCVLVMRETYPVDDLAGRIGGKRTLTFIIPHENQTDVGALAARFIAPGTTISADEHDAYDLLHGRYRMRRVNHQREYRAADGTTDNQAESLFSRFRRMQIGQHHHFGLAHLANYANEAAYREDTRRWSNGEIFSDILTKCARTRPHRDWSGYWQGNTRRPERLAA